MKNINVQIKKEILTDLPPLPFLVQHPNHSIALILKDIPSDLYCFMDLEGRFKGSVLGNWKFSKDQLLDYINYGNASLVKSEITIEIKS